MNIENVNRLARFILVGTHPWSFNLGNCFLGQYSVMINEDELAVWKARSNWQVVKDWVMRVPAPVHGRTIQAD